jgi:tetratricopeptide (TPR) repeat protein
MMRTIRSKFTGALAILGLLVAVGGGCASQPKKATASEAGKRQWNAARAGALAGLAKDQFQSGSLDQARQSLTEAIKLDPENANIRVLSAKVAIEQAQLELAENELRLARQFNPKNPEADYLSGVVYQRWEKPDVAYEFYSHACDKAPAELSYLMAKAEMLVAMDRAPEALKLLQERVIYFEHSATIRDAVGQLLVGDKQYARAVDVLRQASVLTPDDLMIREHLALAQYYAKQYDEAATTLTKLLKEERFEKRSDLWATLGECQSQTGKFRDARDSFEAATKIDPSSASLWLGFGKSALQYGDLRRAELALKKADSIDPSSTEVSLLTGYLRLRQERLPEALTAFRKASSVDNADTLSLCMTGYVLQKMGRTDEAIQYYGKALTRNPKDELANKLMTAVQVHE